MKRLFTLMLAVFQVSLLMAAIPEDYYKSLEGKSGSSLKDALKSICRPADFETLSYGTDTWTDGFEKTDVRVVDGKEIWWDMYSNNIVYLPGHSSLNIEHSVANSWFGKKAGSKDAYQDLHHLYPADMSVNGLKSDNPLGVVETATFENRIVRIGAPHAGTSGGASKVFEPADEYKGDFARGYFYISTAYPEAAWQDNLVMFNTDGSLRQWAIEMLLEWAESDPVDSKEIKRNDNIYLIQKNRNPYIDHPELLEYVFGSKQNIPYEPQEPATATERPEAPIFDGHWLTGVNTYRGRWWDTKNIEIDAQGGDLWVSIDGGEYERFGSAVTINAATMHGVDHVLHAYTEYATRSTTAPLRSSVAELTLTSRDPAVTDYAHATWKLVENTADVDKDGIYIVTSQSNDHIMGYSGGTTAQKYLPDVGFVRQNTDNPNDVEELPTTAAVVRFKPASTSGKYLVEVCTPTLESKGYWEVATSGNNMTLKPAAGTAASVSIDADKNAIINFGDKNLNYNPQNVRFTNYGSNSSTNGPIKLYKFDSFPINTIVENVVDNSESPIGIDGSDILLPEGWRLYSISGIEISPSSLPAGIYIAVSGRGKSVKILMP